ncbi:nicotinate-nucleotide--dimethylbenzimidazole phosphoribosyltransferase [Corynebacterium provencense]|uniref:nicotinate-nucleotide--dimethylbenzimidazole phosphoribosyltransferase n=1 Tax=Corynebacterium provencense TaxID=1737425 RepID=UPI0008354C10|nr:nicotinate-nucleotide--dimethylbenzimidazole phosphoribosyltransferase [Corynebacterium provencense]
MTGTDEPLLPALRAWAEDNGAAATLAGEHAPRPLLSVITSDADTGRDVSGGASPLLPLAELADADISVSVVADEGPANGPGLRADQVDRWLAHGRSLADRAVDSGVQLLLLGGSGDPVISASVTGTVCRKEPVSLFNYAAGDDVSAWKRDIVAVRDVLFRTRGYRNGPWDKGAVKEILRLAGDPALATLVGFLSGSSDRRTPVILDGAGTLAAALLAEAVSPGARQGWILPHVPVDAAAAFAAHRLELSPVFGHDLGVSDGAAALTCLPVLRASVVVSRP